MNLLYIGYWGANEGLSQSTINPHLDILSELDNISRIVYISVEREYSESYALPKLTKLTHDPYQSREFSFRMVTKIWDVIQMREKVFATIIRENIDLVICRSSLAGIFGWMQYRNFKLPYVVESFEPHADYMCELGIWKRWGLSYLVQKRWEEKQKITASWLLPVSHHYGKKLLKEEIKAKIETVPCGVDIERFAYRSNGRERVRRSLGISNSQIVGIYVGKFGGIYLEDEAFRVFKASFQAIPNFFLILLGVRHADVEDKMDKFGIAEERTHVGMVPHSEVPNYLSASDFAYSLIKPTPFRIYCCPIKDGEYWANGLPLLIPEAIGDDSQIVEENPDVGVILRLDQNLKENVSKIMGLIKPLRSEKIQSMARIYRSYDRVREVYNRIFLD